MGAITGKQGPDPTNLDVDEQSKILQLVRNGFGLNMAREQASVGYRRYDRTLRTDKNFRRELKNAIAYRRENLVALRYAHAMAGDPMALQFMIARDDKAEVFGWQRREAARLRKAQGQATALDIRQQVTLIRQAGEDAGIGDDEGDDGDGGTGDPGEDRQGAGGVP